MLERWVEWETVLSGVWVVARICPLCIFCSPQLLFTNPLAHRFMGKSLEEDFEHPLIVDEVIEW